MKIVVLLANGFEEGEALFLTDVLRRAYFDVELVSTIGDLMVEGEPSHKSSSRYFTR